MNFLFFTCFGTFFESSVHNTKTGKFNRDEYRIYISACLLTYFSTRVFESKGIG